MKDYTINGLTSHDVDELLFDKLNGKTGYIEIIEGALVNDYFCDDWNIPLNVNGHRVKGRKHMYALGNYLNDWSSDLNMVLTDDDKRYYTLKRNYISKYLQDDKTEMFLTFEEKANLRFELAETVQNLKACK